MKKLTVLYAIAGLLLIAPAVFAHGSEEECPMGGMMWGHGFGWIFPVLIITVLIVICFRMMGRRGGGSSWCGHGEQKDSETPLDILKSRYAKGEISKEEFETMKEDL